MKTWQKWIIKLARKLGAYGTLDTNLILKEKNKRILELEHELEQVRGFTMAYVDPTVRTKGYPQSAAYDNLGPITDQPTIIPNPRGRYAQQRWPEFRKTHLMPTVKRPPQDEPPFTSMEMTAVKIPIWLL